MRLDEHQVVATIRRVELHELRVWVREGWVKPVPGDRGPMFDDLDVARIRLICDLTQDISIEGETLPVVLSLLDQIHGLRRELSDIAHSVDQQPDEVRKAITEAYRALSSERG